LSQFKFGYNLIPFVEKSLEKLNHGKFSLINKFSFYVAAASIRYGTPLITKNPCEIISTQAWQDTHREVLPFLWCI